MRILELTHAECVEMLRRLRVGRLACSRDDQPYVVPCNFAYDDERHLYGIASPGQKIEWMRANPRVCVEADEILDHHRWSSLVVQGHYEELPDTGEWTVERHTAHALLQRRAMWWEPACVKENGRGAPEAVVPLYYRIHVDRMSGRRGEQDPVEAAAPVRHAPRSGWKSRLRGVLRGGSARPR